MSNNAWKFRRSPRHHREKRKWVVDLDIDFSDEEYALFERAAAGMGLTVGEFIRVSVEDLLVKIQGRVIDERARTSGVR